MSATIIEVIIPMKPVAKERPRSGAGKFYTPKKTHSAERTIGLLVSNKMKVNGIRSIETGPVKVTALFSFNIAGTKKQGCWKATRPDVDNLGKTVLDALNGVAFKDDGQVAEFICRKKFSNEDSVTVRIESLQAA